MKPFAPSRCTWIGSTLVFLSALNPPFSTCFAQGNLTPPGAPAPTMKSLDQIEPRVAISSAPFTISLPGSYYLTTNVTGVSGTNGITIAANDVTLDLAGFALIGVPGAGFGINVPALQTNLCVRNGTVRGWNNLGIFANCVNGQFEHLNLSDNGNGIQAGSGCLLASCTFYNNLNSAEASDACTIRNCLFQTTGTGLVAADSCTVESCTAIGNAFTGITVGNGCTVKDCTANANFPAGIRAGNGCTLEGCSALSNTSTGIVAGMDCVLKGCTARNNFATGIALGNAAAVEHCTSLGNGVVGIDLGDGSALLSSVATSNGQDGIRAGRSCSIRDCAASSNAISGFRIDDGSSIRDCTSGSNSNGIVVSSSCLVLDNACDLNRSYGILAAGRNNRIDGNHIHNPPTNSIVAWCIFTKMSTNIIIRNSLIWEGQNYLGTVNGDYLSSFVSGAGAAYTNRDPYANFTIP